jgi:hypothetical protein
MSTCSPSPEVVLPVHTNLFHQISPFTAQI